MPLLKTPAGYPSVKDGIVVPRQFSIEYPFPEDKRFCHDRHCRDYTLHVTNSRKANVVGYLYVQLPSRTAKVHMKPEVVSMGTMDDIDDSSDEEGMTLVRYFLRVGVVKTGFLHSLNIYFTIWRRCLALNDSSPHRV